MDGNKNGSGIVGREEYKMTPDLIAPLWVLGSLAAVVIAAWIVLIVDENNTPKGG